MTSTRLTSLLILSAVVISCTVFQTVHAQDDDGKGFEGLGGNQVCPSYSCPKGTVPISKWPLSIVSTGCQGGGGMMMMSMGGDDQYKHIEHCCHHKQACYQTCGMNKQSCDAEVKKCMAKGCEELPGIPADKLDSMSASNVEKEKEACDKTKGIVDLITNMGGCQEFESHQRAHCDCVEKDKLEGKMERVLRNFYKKFNPDGVDKVKGLVKKADGKRANFNKILYSLVKKYPDAIKKKKTDMQGMMDGMKMDL